VLGDVEGYRVRWRKARFSSLRRNKGRPLHRAAREHMGEHVPLNMGPKMMWIWPRQERGGEEDMGSDGSDGQAGRAPPLLCTGVFSLGLIAPKWHTVGLKENREK